MPGGAGYCILLKSKWLIVSVLANDCTSLHTCAMKTIRQLRYLVFLQKVFSQIWNMYSYII